MYVIGRQGDQVEMQFSTANLTAPAPGMVRDYFFEVAAWFKDPLGQWGFGFNFTTNPLPFMAMSGFPYPSNESYPYDAAHLAYLAEYNTREILATTNSAGATSTIQSLFAPTNNTAAKANTQIITTITFVAVVALASVLIDFGVLWYARKIKK
jgi:hypothetical protein